MSSLLRYLLFSLKFCVTYFKKFSFVSTPFQHKENTLFSLDKNGNTLSSFRGHFFCLCSLLCKSLLWNLIFFDFRNRTKFYTPLYQKKNKYCNFVGRNTCFFEETLFSPPGSRLFSNLSLILFCSVVAMTRTLPARHPFASSRLISCFIFFSCFQCLLFFFLR